MSCCGVQGGKWDVHWPWSVCEQRQLEFFPRHVDHKRKHFHQGTKVTYETTWQLIDVWTCVQYVGNQIRWESWECQSLIDRMLLGNLCIHIFTLWNNKPVFFYKMHFFSLSESNWSNRLYFQHKLRRWSLFHGWKWMLQLSVDIDLLSSVISVRW